MSRPVSNTNIITDTWEVLVLKVNTLLDALSNETMTANATGATTGNTTAPRISELVGSFGANTVAVTGSLQGGNVSTPAALPITSNVVVNNSIITIGNTTFQSTFSKDDARIGNTSANAVVNTTNFLIQSNTTVKIGRAHV